MERPMEIEKHETGVERIERFQSLQPGQYWRAKEQIGHEGIDKDEVLLLESIKWVDDTAHTIVLRAHPLKYDTSGAYEYPDGKGGKVTRHITWRQHQFLLPDFLDNFEFEPDAQIVRTKELASVQAAVDQRQAEMVEFSSNPEVVAKVIEDGLRAEEEKARQGDGGTNLPALSNEAARAAAAVATGSVGNALLAGITEQKIEMLKAAANRQHLIATIQSNWITNQSKAISDTVARMTPFYHEKAAAALAQTEETRNYVAKIMSGVASLDLYVGKDVFVETVREGASAAKDEPLTFVQSKLCMDEELAMLLDVDEWFDFSSIDKFFGALRENDELVRQIFPAERCVVAMASTRRSIDYGDGLTNYFRNKKNHQVFLLVRDGWNIHQVISPVESHLGANKLFPSKGDGDRMFRGVDGSQIKFNEIAFAEKHARQASATLHYKRFLILCAGLDHRLKLFGEFYDERDAMQFVSLEFQERYCRFIRDGDASASLPKIERQPVSEWIREKNAFVQSGSRLVCNWYTLITPKTAPTLCDEGQRGNFSVRFGPKDRAGIAIAYRDGKTVCVDVEVSGENRTNYETRTFNAKINLSAYEGSYYSDEIAYLCLDKVSLDDIDWYIHNRGSRVNHIAYIRLFKVAAKMLMAERLVEADTRGHMKQALIDGKVADESDIDGIVDTAVTAWRAANRGKPLPVFEGSKAPKEWKGILDQMFVVARGADERIEKAEAFLAARNLTPLRLTVSGDGRIVAYAAPKEDERDDRFEPHCSVHRIAIDFKKGEAKERSRRWTRMLRSDGKENVLKEWEAAKGWFDLPSSFMSLSAKQTMLAQFTDLSPRIERFSRKLERDAFEALFSDWETQGKDVDNAGIAFPFALVKTQYGELKIMSVGIDRMFVLLSKLAPSAEDAERVRNAYLRRYSVKTHAANVFDNYLARHHGLDWQVYGFDPKDVKTEGVVYFDGWAHDYKTVARVRGVDPLLGPATEKWLKSAKSVYYSPDMAAMGMSFLDETLGISRPDDYGPYRIETVRVSKRQSDEAVPFNVFVDTAHEDVGNAMREARDARPSVWGDIRMTSVSTTAASKTARDRYIAEKARDEGGRLVHHSQLPEAPQPIDGVDRWYIVKD
jgi:hypothetical protein